MKKFQAIVLIFSILTLTGCATVFKGYEDTLNITNAPADLKVLTKEGEELVVTSKTARIQDKKTYNVSEVNVKSIMLRSNDEHVLILKTGGTEKTVKVYPKISAGWLIFDFITGIFPVFIDMYTGNWNYFEPIAAGF